MNIIKRDNNRGIALYDVEYNGKLWLTTRTLDIAQKALYAIHACGGNPDFHVRKQLFFAGNTYGLNMHA